MDDFNKSKLRELIIKKLNNEVPHEYPGPGNQYGANTLFFVVGHNCVNCRLGKACTTCNGTGMVIKPVDVDAFADIIYNVIKECIPSILQELRETAIIPIMES